jgi:type VI secretion system Hcp family effector
MNFVRALRSGLLLLTCCIAMPASGDDIYFSIEGAVQGKITGEVVQDALKGKMRAVGFGASINQIYDTVTRNRTASRSHLPLHVSREPGRGSPQLMHAMVTNEVLKEVRFDFYTPRIINGAKVMTLYQSIKLTNAFLVGFNREAEPATDLSGGAVRSRENLVFTYEKFDLIDVERNVSATDLW